MKIALAGNPNCGKTTLFNALTGSNQFVGNWPGVTVEKKEGKLKGHKDVIIMDLPGIYSLSPYTLEEVVARNYLIKEYPDAIRERYKIEIPEEFDPWDLVEAAGRKRGFLISGGEVDTERMAKVLLDEYRSCKLGRFTLESPEMLEEA